MNKSSDDFALPFIKWPGGKRWLNSTIINLLDGIVYNTYIEPFVGGGSLFFRLNPKKSILADLNKDLINAYLQVKNDYSKVINILKKINVSSETYYNIRSQKPKSKVRKAANFLYLNRTCFGGIYRTNGKGKFNVPYGGGQRTHNILWEKNLLSNASKRLKNTRLYAQDFQETFEYAKKGDLIYCDPPYRMAKNNGEFLRYNPSLFSWEDQERLAKICTISANNGKKIIISNAFHPDIKELFSDFECVEIQRKTTLSPVREARRSIKEYLFYYLL